MHEFNAIEGYTIPAGKALMLRTCAADFTSRGGFQWPQVGGVVEAPDWNPESECGDGLHGALWGEGDGSLLSWKGDAVWMVAEVNAADAVGLGGKVKAPRARVVCSGPRHDVTAWLWARRPAAVIGATVQAGHRGTATAGYRGTATAGYRGTATAGDEGAATAGDGGTATAGDEGAATAGEWGTATAGEWGMVRIDYWHGRWRTAVGYIGETMDRDGAVLAAGVAYKCDNEGRFYRAEEAK